jgi:hypothetical protein
LNGRCGFVEAVDVLIECEDSPIIGFDPFKDPIPVEKSMVKNRYFGLFLIHEFTIDVYDHRNALLR